MTHLIPRSVGESNEVEVVADYLRTHPEFFTKHPDVLMELEIAHSSGAAVSLLERQLSALREQNRQLRTRFHELVNIARENEELSRRMHRMTLALLRAEDAATFFAVLPEDWRMIATPSEP